jgi:hypothetical protein
MNKRPHESSETMIRTSNALKNLSYALNMDAAFVHTFSESMTIAAQRGVGNILMNDIPALGRIIRDYTSGRLDEGTQSDLMLLNSSLANSMAITQAGARFDTDLAGEASSAFLRNFEKFAEGTKRTASQINLLGPSTDMARQFSAVTSLRQLDDFLMGKKMPKWWDGYRRQLGLRDEALDGLRRHFRDNVPRDKKGRIDPDKVDGLALHKMPAQDRLELENFLYRSVSTSIQQIERGSVPQVFTHPLGSLLLQFRSFGTGATTRHTLADLKRRDALALKKFVGSSIVASLTYMARAQLFNFGDEETQEERMRPDRIIANGIAYSVNAGLLPSVIDTVGATAFGGVTPFNRYRTTGLSDNVLSDFGVGQAPALGVAADATRAAGIPFQMGWDALSGRGFQGLSKQQAEALFTVSGASIAWPLRPLQSYLTKDLEDEREMDRGNPIEVWKDIKREF